MTKQIAINLYNGVSCTIRANDGVYCTYNTINCPPDFGKQHFSVCYRTLSQSRSAKHLRWIQRVRNNGYQIWVTDQNNSSRLNNFSKNNWRNVTATATFLLSFARLNNYKWWKKTEWFRLQTWLNRATSLIRNEGAFTPQRVLRLPYIVAVGGVTA